MIKSIRIQPRDKELLQELINFNGLPGPEIIDKYFKNSKTYGYRRLKELEDNDYIKRKYYYAQNKKDGVKFAQRIAAIYYATGKGCKEVACNIDSRYVIPDDDKLDVTNLVGKLYFKIPNLLSRRQTIAKYELQNFMPISCSIPGDSPAFIYVLGNTIGRYDIGRIKSFIEADIITNARHYIISRTFPERFLLSNSYFIPWNLALEYLPNIAKDKNCYLNEFLTIIQKELPEIRLLSNIQPLLRAQYKNKVLHLGELVSGSNHLRLILHQPPENTIIYAPSRVHFYGIKLRSEEDSFIFYSQRDKAFFKMILNEKNRMNSVSYKINCINYNHTKFPYK